MTLSKRTALGISLGAIVLYWIYQIVSQRPDAPLPAHFSDLVWRIVCTKIIVLAALFLLLRLEGEGFEALGLSVSRMAEASRHGFALRPGDVRRVECRARLGDELAAPPAGGERTVDLDLLQGAEEPAGLAADRDLRGRRGGGTPADLHFHPLREMAGTPGSHSRNRAELGDVWPGAPLPGARDRDLDCGVGSALRACLSAPALRPRAHHCARFQRRPRHAGRDDAGKVALARLSHTSPESSCIVGFTGAKTTRTVFPI